MKDKTNRMLAVNEINHMSVCDGVFMIESSSSCTLAGGVVSFSSSSWLSGVLSESSLLSWVVIFGQPCSDLQLKT